MNKKAAEKQSKARARRKLRERFLKLVPEHLRKETANSVSNKDIAALEAELERNDGGSAAQETVRTY